MISKALAGFASPPGRTMEPMAPLPGVGRKAMSAVSAVRTLHDGHHSSGWCEEMERQIFMPVSKRPLGVSMMMDGGLKGYSGGSKIRPWYKPPWKGQTINPRFVLIR
jgi:hypothetical protein